MCVLRSSVSNRVLAWIESWLVRSTLEQALLVRALAAEIALCSCALDIVVCSLHPGV